MVEISPQVRRFLSEPARFTVLATPGSSGMPQQSVMWYRFDDDVIMMNTARGRIKDRNLLRDNRASVCFEDGYRYVTITGEITMIDEQDRAQSDIHALAAKYHGKDEADKMMTESFGKQERVTLLLSIDRVDAHGFD
jgi:PPOX class probable F420-dependent enzyme